jgi:hypothetical protein
MTEMKHGLKVISGTTPPTLARTVAAILPFL